MAIIDLCLLLLLSWTWKRQLQVCDYKLIEITHDMQPVLFHYHWATLTILNMIWPCLLLHVLVLTRSNCDCYIVCQLLHFMSFSSIERKLCDRFIMSWLFASLCVFLAATKSARQAGGDASTGLEVCWAAWVCLGSKFSKCVEGLLQGLEYSQAMLPLL